MLSHISRPRRVAIWLALVAAIALGIWFGISTLTSADATPAVEQLRSAAEERPFGSTDKLISDLRSRVDATPDDAEGHAQLGAAYLQLARETGDPGNYGRAAEALDRALELAPENLEALIGKGSLALSQHDFETALRLGMQARELNDTIPRVHGLIGDAQVELGRYPEAVETIQTMVDMRPDLASYSRVAYLRELHGDLEGATDAMERAVAAGGPSIENTEYVRVQLGHLHLATGDLPAAERAYAESLTHLTDYPYALAGLARVRAAQGNLVEAIELYQRASSRIPIPEFVIGLGEALEAAGRDEEAADQYALVEAIQQLLEANGVRSDLELAAFLAEHGSDPDEAVAYARAAYAARPTVFAADALAWALHAAGDDEAAGPFAEEALRLDTDSSLILYHAGVIAAANGNVEVARERLERSLDLNPAFAPLHAQRAEAALAALPPTR